MKTKFAALLLIVVSLLTFSLLGCEQNDDWHYNAEGHWKESRDGQISEFAVHALEGDICTVCGYDRTKKEDTGDDKNAVNGLIYSLSNDGQSYWVTGIGKVTETAITIPSTYNGKPVVSIGNNAFFNCADITSVIMPNSVTNIGKNAFDGCTNLQSVTIGTDVTNIDSYTFRNCSSLQSVVIPTGVTSIGSYAFSGCSSLDSIEIPVGITNIAKSTFEGCSGLESVVIPTGVTNLGDNVFSGCSSLQSVVIPTGVTNLGDNVFSGCSNLESVAVPDSVMSIGDRAFYGCSSLVRAIIGNGVLNIGNQVFSHCSILESITVPFVGAKKSAEYASSSTVFGYLFGVESFKGSVAVSQSYSGYDAQLYYIPATLREVTITGGSLYYGAFYGCSMLTSVVIYNYVPLIEEHAFTGCSGLKKVFYKGAETQWGSATAVGSNNTPLTSATRYYYSETTPTTAGNWWHFGSDGITPEIWG